MSVPIRPAVEQLQAYPPGLPEEEIKRRHGLEKITKLASNENPLGPSPKALEALRSDEILTLGHRYPDLYELRQALAHYTGIDAGNIMLGNGSDEIVIQLALTYLTADHEIIVSKGDFIRYKMAAQLMGANITEVPLVDWQHDVDTILSSINDKTKIVFLASPSNPIGSMLRKGEAEKLAARIPSDVIFVLDQAYHEYACNDDAYPDTEALLNKHPNLVALRTFSKAFGLAGLRLGYGLNTGGIAAQLERVRPPFNINRLAVAAGIAALTDEDHLRKSHELNEVGRPQLENFYNEVGLSYVPTYANFHLVDLGIDCLAACKQFQQRGVIVRSMKGYGFPTHVRVSIGTSSENDHWIQVCSEVINKSAVKA